MCENKFVKYDTMPRRKATQEIVEEMRRLRREGMSYGKIAVRFGLSPMTVYNHLQKKGKGRRTRITPEIVEEMADMRRRGLTYEEIAEKLGIAFQTVAKYMREEGLSGRRRKVTREVMERMRELRGPDCPKRK